MTISPGTGTNEEGSPGPEEQWRPRRRRWRIIALAAVVLIVAAGVWVATADPFASKAANANGVSDNPYPTSVTTVARQSISSQTEVSATLTYAGATEVVLPAGTAPSDLVQAQDAVSVAKQALESDEAALQATEEGNTDALAQSEQSVTAALATFSSDEASLQSTDVANSQTLSQAQSSVPDNKATLSSDEAALKSTEVANSQAVAQAEASVQAAQATLSSDKAGMSSTDVANSQAVAPAEAPGQ